MYGRDHPNIVKQLFSNLEKQLNLKKKKKELYPNSKCEQKWAIPLIDWCSVQLQIVWIS